VIFEEAGVSVKVGVAMGMALDSGELAIAPPPTVLDATTLKKYEVPPDKPETVQLLPLELHPREPFEACPEVVEYFTE